MGNFRIEIEAVGGHGEHREIGDGQPLGMMRYPLMCPDGVAYSAVRALKDRGCDVKSAKLVHWPGQESEVVDDVLEDVRHGSF